MRHKKVDDQTRKAVGDCLMQLRKILGEGSRHMSYPEIMRRSGVPTGTYSVCEAGERSLPDVAAHRLEVAFGCSSIALLRGKLLFLDGKKFTKEKSESWQKRVPTEKEIQWAKDDLAFRLKMMIQASGHGIYGFTWAVSRALDEAAKNAGITKEALDAVCRQNADLKTEEMSVKEFAEKMMPMCGKTTDEAQFLLGRYKPYDVVSVVAETYHAVPDTADDEEMKAKIMGHEGGSPLFLLAHKKKRRIFRATLPDGGKLELRDSPGKAVAVGDEEKTGGTIQYNQG